jgi:hypothetical protein
MGASLASSTSSTQVAHPGAFCAPLGAHGVTGRGTSMTCKRPPRVRGRTGVATGGWIKRSAIAPTTSAANPMPTSMTVIAMALPSAVLGEMSP